MSRRIVICIDGTNNYPGGGYTNIQRILRMLKRDDEQLGYYQAGVGTVEPNSLTTRTAQRFWMLLDSMSAVMLERHVCDAYRFLMNEYRDGDQLYFFGFSRGAFAARVLAGMLTSVGLLHRGLDSMVPFAWSTYLSSGAAENRGEGETQRARAADFRQHYSRFIKRIEFLGLFDTVSAVGVPWGPKFFPHTFKNPRVACVRHALSLDERRVIFVQNRWKDTDDEPHPSTDVKQIWFSGVHSDVGGGYPEAEAGLSLIPLAWMLREAQSRGLTVKPVVSARILDPTQEHPAPTVQFVTEAQSEQPTHDELPKSWLWRLLEYSPVPRRRLGPEGDWRTEWIVHRGAGRSAGAVPCLHESVRIRMAAGYQPRASFTDPTFEW